MKHNIMIALFASILWGCAGNMEARQLAARMANASSEYIKAVDRKLDLEQKFYASARNAYKTQLARKRANRETFQNAGYPPLELLTFVEELARDNEQLKLPGDLFAVLERYNKEQIRIRLALAENERKLRKVFDVNVAKLAYKRAKLEEMRKQFEVLSQSMSAKDWFEFVAQYAKDIQKEIGKQKKADEDAAANLDKMDT